MAIKQTRRSVSLSSHAYQLLQQLAHAHRQSMAAIVESLISDAAQGKPDAVAKAPRGGGPVDAFALKLADRCAAESHGVVTWAELARAIRKVQS